MTEGIKALHGKEYVARFESEQSPMRLKRLMCRVNVSDQMKICDFGCGNGRLIQYLCPVVSEYVGVDFSEDFIVAARKRQDSFGFNNATFFCDDINHFCAERPIYFDAAFAMDLSEHVPDEQWLEILKSIRSSLKSGGVLYLHTPNARFFIEIMKRYSFVLKQFPEHVAVRDAAHNEELLHSAGFSTVEVNFLPHYNVLKCLHPLSFIPFFGRYFQSRLFIRVVA